MILLSVRLRVAGQFVHDCDTYIRWRCICMIIVHSCNISRWYAWLYYLRMLIIIVHNIFVLCMIVAICDIGICAWCMFMMCMYVYAGVKCTYCYTLCMIVVNVFGIEIASAHKNA